MMGVLTIVRRSTVVDRTPHQGRCQAAPQGRALKTQSDDHTEEMVQDLMTIIHCFSSRLYGLHNYRKTLSNALKEPTP